MFNSLLNPSNCPATAFLWELCKKEGLVLPVSSDEIFQSLDGELPIFWWIAENGIEVRMTFDAYNMKVTIEELDEASELLTGYEYKLVPMFQGLTN